MTRRSSETCAARRQNVNVVESTRRKGNTILAEVVSIPTDTIELDGLLYEPTDQPAIGCVQLFHGNGMNFYVGPPRFLPERLVNLGFACLAYNRRGHDILSTRNSRMAEGNAFQTTAQAVADNRYAAQWLATRGYDNPVVVGHSNGGMLAVRHVTDHPQTPALVLMSAHRGSRRMVEIASQKGLLACDQLDAVTERAHLLIDTGRGAELMLLPGWWYVTTASSWVDLLNNTPDILELASEIRCPTLYVRGDQEPADLYPAEEFQARSGGCVDVLILDGCDHFYNGVEGSTADAVGDWLASTVDRRTS